MTDYSAKIIQHPLPPNISEQRLQEIREEVAAQRKAEALARKILGYEEPSDLNERFIEHLLNFPKIDCDDSIFARYPETHPDIGDSDVPR
ncbi:hypothetical protein [Caballeronia insecticola]|uniref:hypothetical protein n=1 Tax=Caballeronia insecticola TaxID=758793 RepID=UPI0005C74FD7|nr:hypothetical protein [Caballeronia insecticola]